jgi:hypothetical protein
MLCGCEPQRIKRGWVRPVALLPYPACAGRRSVALRPTLSRGLPFSSDARVLEQRTCQGAAAAREGRCRRAPGISGRVRGTRGTGRTYLPSQKVSGHGRAQQVSGVECLATGDGRVPPWQMYVRAGLGVGGLNLTPHGYGRLHAPPVYRRLWRTVGYERRRGRGRIGTEDRQSEVPEMSRGKRRGRGEGTGAEDKDSRAEMARNGEVNRVGVAQDTVRRAWVWMTGTGAVVPGVNRRWGTGRVPSHPNPSIDSLPRTN